MKYKVGDRVKVKSLDWYNENKNEFGEVRCKGCPFVNSMTLYCNSILTIEDKTEDCYWVKENAFNWTDEMIEELVEAEDEKKLSDESWRYKNIFDYSQYPQSFECPEGYIFKDENGNVINAQKIILEKKKKEYPKTYEECCKVLDFCGEYFFTTYEDGIHLPENDNIVKIHQTLKSVSVLTKLLICRNAYWKIAGEEMGLGKPWEPDWEDESDKFTIGYFYNDIDTDIIRNYESRPLAFPTKEMRDAFKENFDPDIEICKELL